MDSSIITTNLGKITQGAEGVVPGLQTIVNPTPSALEQTVQSNPSKYVPNPQGAQVLQVRAQVPYSNKQFIAPLKFSLNVEGTSIIVDYLGKRIITDNNVPYRQIVSLSATPLANTIINDPSLNNPDRTAKVSSTQSVAAKMFNSGTTAVTQSLGGRTSQYTSLLQSAGSQIGSLASGNVFANAAGQVSNLLPQAQVTQSLAKIPGLSVATNALGNIPGTADFTKALFNPVGATTTFVQGLFEGSNLNLQGGLPSLGSLQEVFGLAASIASNGPPTSLTGIIALEKQVKSIVCNFVLPILKIPNLKSILSFKFHNPLDDLKKIVTEFENEISNIINSIDIVQILQDLLPDPHAIYDAIVKEITTCDTAPTNKQNAKNGK